MFSFSYLFILQILSCSFMTGLIWIVQVLHYPSFALIKDNRFAEFHEFHTRRITFIVLPAMTLELTTAIAILYFWPQSLWLWVNASTLLMIWMSTFFLSVPIHNKLSKGPSLESVRRLVITNWFRTGLWSLRFVILGYLALHLLEVNNVNFSK